MWKARRGKFQTCRAPCAGTAHDATRSWHPAFNPALKKLKPRQASSDATSPLPRKRLLPTSHPQIPAAPGPQARTSPWITLVPKSQLSHPPRTPSPHLSLDREASLREGQRVGRLVGPSQQRHQLQQAGAGVGVVQPLDGLADLGGWGKNLKVQGAVSRGLCPITTHPVALLCIQPQTCTLATNPAVFMLPTRMRRRTCSALR